jgi:hypothetical protein
MVIESSVAGNVKFSMVPEGAGNFQSTAADKCNKTKISLAMPLK